MQYTVDTRTLALGESGRSLVFPHTPPMPTRSTSLLDSSFGGSCNAFDSLQTFKNQPSGEPLAPLLPFAEMPYVEKEKANAFDIVDYYGSIVPKHQGGARILVMEGSENCMKSEVSGPPLNFGEPGATTASAHVYQAAARAICANQPEDQEFQMLHQGGRALYADEDFDEDACAVVAASGQPIAAARTVHAGTMAWMGQEAVRRAEMQTRPRVCGVVKKPLI